MLARLVAGSVLLARLRRGATPADGPSADLFASCRAASRTLVARSGETAEVAYIRKAGHRPSGRVVGLVGTEAAGAIVTVENADADPSDRRPLPKLIHEALGTGQDGRFTTARLAPGTYAVVAEVYLPEKPEGVFRTGWRLPDLVGVAEVTVPALRSQPAPEVVIALKPYEPPRPEPPPVPPQRAAIEPPATEAPAAAEPDGSSSPSPSPS